MTCHRHLKPGRVLTGSDSTPPGDCICCGMDAEGFTVETWSFVGPTSTYGLCYWCQELWDARGELVPYLSSHSV